VEGNEATIGVSDYAQEQLNDIVYVELPDVGAEYKKGDTFGVVESVRPRRTCTCLFRARSRP
jgi:glycine cleavage system H protein